MIDDAKLALLRKRAWERGFVTTGDLRDVLPVERMSADEVAGVVVFLEESGVAVELEDALKDAARRREPTAPETPVIDLPAGQPPSRDARRPAAAPGVAPDAFTAPEPVSATSPLASGGWPFVLAAAIAIALGAIILFALAR
ncbi:MAG: RNA polymerase sigma factor region1.1 domain-containing protein [Beijerinckiaceae bacterium]